MANVKKDCNRSQKCISSFTAVLTWKGLVCIYCTFCQYRMWRLLSTGMTVALNIVECLLLILMTLHMADVDDNVVLSV